MGSSLAFGDIARGNRDGTRLRPIDRYELKLQSRLFWPIRLTNEIYNAKRTVCYPSRLITLALSDQLAGADQTSQKSPCRLQTVATSGANIASAGRMHPIWHKRSVMLVAVPDGRVSLAHVLQKPFALLLEE